MQRSLAGSRIPREGVAAAARLGEPHLLGRGPMAANDGYPNDGSQIRESTAWPTEGVVLLQICKQYVIARYI